MSRLTWARASRARSIPSRPRSPSRKGLEVAVRCRARLEIALTRISDRSPRRSASPGWGPALLLALLGFVVLPSPVASAKVSKDAERNDEATTRTGDGDRSGIFDALEQRLLNFGQTSSVDVIVTLKRPASTPQIEALQRGVGRFKVRSRFHIIEAFAARMSKEEVEALARRSDVATVEPDLHARALNHTEQEGFGVTRARLDAPHLDGNRDGNRATYSTRDIVAAVVDTGIHRYHRDLDEGKVLAFVDCTSGVCRGRTAFDDSGHGTHVAATIAGEGDARTDRLHRGAAPDAALVGIKSLGSNGTGAYSNVVAGIDWAVADRSRYGIRVINLSLGAIPCSDGTDAMSRAANRAASAGLIVVAAAGNDGPRRCTVTSPAAASGALAVGSMFEPPEGGSSRPGHLPAGRRSPPSSRTLWLLVRASHRLAPARLRATRRSRGRARRLLLPPGSRCSCLTPPRRSLRAK